MDIYNIYENDELTHEELTAIMKGKANQEGLPGKVFIRRMYSLAKEEYNREKKEKEIIEKMYKDTKNRVRKIHLIGEDSAIIETFEDMFNEGEKPWYRICYNGKISDIVTDNFDHAIVMLLCRKYDTLHNSDAAVLISRMLGINL